MLDITWGSDDQEVQQKSGKHQPSDFFGKRPARVVEKKYGKKESAGQKDVEGKRSNGGTGGNQEDYTPDEQQVVDVAADDIAFREFVLVESLAGQGGYQFRQGGSDGSQCKTQKAGGQAGQERNILDG